MDLAKLCAGFRQHPVSVICDAMYALGVPEQVLASALRPLLPDVRIAGEAFTVRGKAIGPLSWGEGIPRIRPYLQIFEELTPDSILVSVNPDSPVGHFGELTANAARSKGCQGVVLSGNLRDTEGLKAIGFQAFYSGLSPTNAIGRWEMAAKQVPVVIGNVEIIPGDIVVADYDGVVVIPRADADRVLLEASSIDAAEALVRQEAATGVPPSLSFDKHGHI